MPGPVKKFPERAARARWHAGGCAGRSRDIQLFNCFTQRASP